MLVAWFVVSALLAGTVFVLNFSDTIDVMKDFRGRPSLAIILLAIESACVASMIMGSLCLVRHFSYNPERTRCSSIESGVYERESHKCYVNGEEK